MQTEVLDGCEVGIPFLESFSAAGEPAERTPLDSLPVTIGRIEAVDLQIKSNRVSREHAVIVRENDAYLVRDLGSTNGTQVNGEPIEETTLQDGDVLTIADAQFTFVCRDERQTCRMATQVMSESTARGPRGPSRRDQVFGLRRMRESLLHQAFDVKLRPIMRLATNDIFGYSELVRQNNEALGFSGNIDLDLQCHMATRFRQLIRSASVDQFLALDQGGYLFLHVSAAELDRVSELRSHLVRVSNRVPSSMTLVAQFPAAVADDMPQQQELRNALDEMGIQLAYGDAVISSQQLLTFQGTHPSFVVLSPRMISDVIRHRHQQRQLAGLLSTCAEIGCQAIADGVTTPDHQLCCQELGFQFGLSDTYDAACAAHVST